MSQTSKVYGVVVAIVTDNVDPEGLGRIKLKYPWLADEFTSHWARMGTPMGGPDRGFMFLPEVDDEVLVAFEHGDVNRPFVIGCLWNGVDKPPMPNDKAVSGGKVRHRRIKTRYGHMIDLDDNGRIVIQTKGGHRMTLSDKDGGLSLTSKKGYSMEIYEGGSHIAMFSPGGHAIGINDKERFIVLQEATGNTVKIDGLSGIITIDAMNSVVLKGGASLNLSGAMINLNGPPAAPSKGKIDPETAEAKEIENT